MDKMKGHHKYQRLWHFVSWQASDKAAVFLSSHSVKKCIAVAACTREKEEEESKSQGGREREREREKKREMEPRKGKEEKKKKEEECCMFQLLDACLYSHLFCLWLTSFALAHTHTE